MLEKAGSFLFVYLFALEILIIKFTDCFLLYAMQTPNMST